MNTAQLIAALAGGAAAGALLTALTSLFTGWLSRRHEHRRWLLDNRLETYAAFNKAMNGFQLAYQRKAFGQAEGVDALNEALIQLHDTQQGIALLAPEDTSSKADGLVEEAQTASAAVAGGTRSIEDARANQAWVEQLAILHGELVERQRRDVQRPKR